MAQYCALARGSTTSRQAVANETFEIDSFYSQLGLESYTLSRCCRMLKEIEQAFVLQQPLDNIEVSLSILSDIAVGFKRLAQPEFILGQRTKACEHVIYDILYRFVLKDSRVEAACKHPKPRAKNGSIANKATIATLSTETIYITIYVTMGAVGELNLYSRQATDQ